MITRYLIVAAAALIATAPGARAQAGSGEQRFRDLYKELVETKHDDISNA